MRSGRLLTRSRSSNDCRRGIARGELLRLRVSARHSRDSSWRELIICLSPSMVSLKRRDVLYPSDLSVADCQDDTLLTLVLELDTELPSPISASKLPDQDPIPGTFLVEFSTLDVCWQVTQKHSKGLSQLIEHLRCFLPFLAGS